MFTDYLELIFPMCGLDSTKYKDHSFRIGAATLLQNAGFPMHKFVSWVVGNLTFFKNIYSGSMPVLPSLSGYTITFYSD